MDEIVDGVGGAKPLYIGSQGIIKKKEQMMWEPMTVQDSQDGMFENYSRYNIANTVDPQLSRLISFKSTSCNSNFKCIRI